MPMESAPWKDQPGTLALIDNACERVTDALSKLDLVRSTLRQSQQALATSQQQLMTDADT
jgi:hypothetical protein